MMNIGVRRSQSLRYPKGTVNSTSGSRKGARGRCRSLKRSGDLTRLSAHQQQALLTSWNALRPIIPSVIRKILTDLENQIPAVKKIFYKAAVLDAFHRESTSENLGTLDEHVKLVIGFFDDIVNNVNNEEDMSKRIKKVGQCHVVLNQSSFNAEIWEKLGEITMECISMQDAVQKTREAGKAWRILIAWVTDQLRCGFDIEARTYVRNLLPNTISEPRQSTHQRHSSDNDTLQQQLRQLRLNYKSTIPL